MVTEEKRQLSLGIGKRELSLEPNDRVRVEFALGGVREGTIVHGEQADVVQRYAMAK